MPNLIDTHAHIYLKEFHSDIAEIIVSAEENGVKQILLPNIDENTIEPLQFLCECFEGVCYPMIGIHPCSVRLDFLNQIQIVSRELESSSYIAIGEIGLDYHWDKSLIPQQKKAFEMQMDLALQYKLPICIHARESMQDCIDLVKPYAKKGLRGVFHCFSGTYEQAIDIVNMNFHLGIGGVVTYKNSGLSEVIKNIPLQHIVLETDSPYLAPTPFRSKRNQPSYLLHIANHVSEIYQLSLEEIAESTTLS